MLLLATLTVALSPLVTPSPRYGSRHAKPDMFPQLTPVYAVPNINFLPAEAPIPAWNSPWMLRPLPSTGGGADTGKGKRGMVSGPDYHWDQISKEIADAGELTSEEGFWQNMIRSLGSEINKQKRNTVPMLGKRSFWRSDKTEQKRNMVPMLGK